MRRAKQSGVGWVTNKNDTFQSKVLVKLGEYITSVLRYFLSRH